MITVDIMLSVMRNERECIARQECDRDCGKCDLVMDSETILAVYDAVIKRLEDEEKKSLS